ncbi:hypothetical protein BCR44DRAFT_1482601 [Catenaria anguillulae PL171]|uniref:Cyclic nucleotide-binding domain-containing protein n=1 Tax=Catenaria anguillulae PL171 TaxID=765915 RepID=A0A1Y2HZN4_9FUNG|nr:hypothetical protein BCR44DRAFT_1482601 [Catenaria anguillulae PL171]
MNVNASQQQPQTGPPLSPSSGSNMDLEYALRNHPLFAGLDSHPGLYNSLANLLTIRHVGPGDILIRAGEEGRALFVLLRGSVAVTSKDGESVYATFGAGSFFGEIAAVKEGIRRTASVVATERSVVATLQRNDLKNVIVPKYGPEIEERLREAAEARIRLLHPSQRTYLQNAAERAQSGMVSLSTPAIAGPTNTSSLEMRRQSSSLRSGSLSASRVVGLPVDENSLLPPLSPIGSTSPSVGAIGGSAFYIVDPTTAPGSFSASGGAMADTLSLFNSVVPTTLNPGAIPGGGVGGSAINLAAAFGPPISSIVTCRAQPPTATIGAFTTDAPIVAGSSSDSEPAFAPPSPSPTTIVAPPPSPMSPTVTIPTNKHMSAVAALNPGRRRASVAVWSDPRLMAKFFGFDAVDQRTRFATRRIHLVGAQAGVGARGAKNLTHLFAEHKVAKRLVLYMGARACFVMQGRTIHQAHEPQILLQHHGPSPLALSPALHVARVAQSARVLGNLTAGICGGGLVQYLPTLRSLDLSNLRKMDDVALRKCLLMFPNLDTLTLGYCKALSMGIFQLESSTHPAVGSASGSEEAPPHSAPPAVTSDTLPAVAAGAGNMLDPATVTENPHTRNRSHSDLTTAPPASLLAPQPTKHSTWDTWRHLRTLNLQRCTGLRDDAFAQWPRISAEWALETLILGDCSLLTDTAMGMIAGTCPRLATLGLAFCCALSEGAMAAIVQMPRLKVVDLSFCGSLVSHASILALARECRELERVGVRGQAARIKVVNIGQCRGVAPEMKARVKQRCVVLETESVIEYVEPKIGESSGKEDGQGGGGKARATGLPRLDWQMESVWAQDECRSKGQRRVRGPEAWPGYIASNASS